MWTRAGKVCFKSNFGRRLLLGCLRWPLCWYLWYLLSTENSWRWRSTDLRYLKLNHLVLRSVTGEKGQLFPGPTERKNDGLDSWREQYKSYKESYVKHLLFTPEEPNICKQRIHLFTKAKFHLCFFSCDVGACSTGGGVHLLWHCNLWSDWKGRQGWYSNFCKEYNK